MKDRKCHWLKNQEMIYKENKMLFDPKVLKQYRHSVKKADIVQKEVKHQRYFNPTYLINATYRTMQDNIRKAGFSVDRITPEKVDYTLDNSNRKIKDGYVSYIISLMTPDGQNRSVVAKIVIENDIVNKGVSHFSDNCGNKYAFNREGLKAFLMGVEEETNKQHETVYPSVGDGGSQSGQAGGAEPNLAFLQNNIKIMKLGHAKDSKITEAKNKIVGASK
jgi:hypothetical protein